MFDIKCEIEDVEQTTIAAAKNNRDPTDRRDTQTLHPNTDTAHRRPVQPLRKRRETKRFASQSDCLV